MSKQTIHPLKIEVERVIDATPETLYDLVSDITRMGEWSPECTEASWLGDTDKPVVGARFKGKNRLGFVRWTTKPTVIEADPGESFAFEVPGKAGPVWRYEFEATDQGTRVTETMVQDAPLNAFIGFLQRRNGVHDRPAHLAEGMTVTLERIDAAATASARTSVPA